MITRLGAKSVDNTVTTINEISEIRFEMILNILIEKGIIDYEEVMGFYGYVDDKGIPLKGDELIEEIKRRDNRVLYRSIRNKEKNVEDELITILSERLPEVKALFDRVKKLEDIINYLKLSLTAFGRLTKEDD